MDIDDVQIKKALVAFTIEKALLEMGEPVFQKVTEILKNDYNCYVPDCYDHPEYLKRVLADLYGNAHTAIISSIKENLREFSHQTPVQKFLVALE
ncbi:MAG: hypothetical protein QXE84_04150 [Candidatus Nitrosotenuis sp.]|uniref:Nitrosopumilus output domain-containing protein n=1 Tax=Candidatus Nitrosotenuis uzonensis TaxID=1407055 RepID=A0A812F002_9ARCH|nr:hypothetical protein [Candidatus Nitrosotenuis uzonensis]CAE6497121.1 conserved hypothetical protein [Candidatus Nitrosotenuis uzonensis]